MNIKRRFSVAITVFIFAIFATSCIKDEIDLKNISDKIQWDPKVGSPVAYGYLSLEDLIESIDSEQVVKEDQDKFLTLVYSNKLLSSTAATILQIENQHFSEVLLESQYSLPAFPTQDTIRLNRNARYSFNFSHGEIIDSINLKAGTLVFNVSSSYKYKGSFRITVPGLVKNKKPLVINVDINKADGTFTSTQTIDLTGYKVQLEHPNVSDNLLEYNYVAKLATSGGGGVKAGDNITVNIDFRNILFSSLFGYIGQRQLLNIQSEFAIPLFQSVSQPNLQFKNPSIKLRTVNSFGLPASVELYNIKAVNDKSDETVALNFSSGVNPFNISYPVSIGKSAKDTVVFNNNTVNLDAALAIAPNHIFYGIRSFANPGGKRSNYVTDSSKVSIDLDVELPLELKTSLVEFSDTLELDMSDLEDNTEKIKSLLLHSSFENGMPADINIQIYLLDEHYNHVDTLLNPKELNLIKSGAIDAQGKVTSKTAKDIDVQFNQSEIDKLKNVRYALVKAGIVTANGGTSFVKFYSNYSIDVFFGVQTELEINED